MHIVKSATIGFVLASALTVLELRKPRSVRPGWFELDGRPCAVDGEPVQDWMHANELFARSASVLCRALEAQSIHDGRWTGPLPEQAVRDLTLDYVPSGGEGRTSVVVRMRLPGVALQGSEHPIGFVRYEIVAPQAPRPSR